MTDYWPSDWPEGVLVGVPMVHDSICEEGSPTGRCACTRSPGHSGRHVASGIPRSNGLCPVYEVWEDDA